MVDEGINSNVENDVKISTNNALKKVLNPTQMASFRMGKECLPITADMKAPCCFHAHEKVEKKAGTGAGAILLQAPKGDHCLRPGDGKVFRG